MLDMSSWSTGLELVLVYSQSAVTYHAAVASTWPTVNLCSCKVSILLASAGWYCLMTETCVNNLPRIVIWNGTAGSQIHDLFDWEYNQYTSSPHTVVSLLYSMWNQLWEFIIFLSFYLNHLSSHVSRVGLCIDLNVLKCVSEAFVVCQNYSPPEGYTPNMFNLLLNNHSGNLPFDYNKLVNRSNSRVLHCLLMLYCVSSGM